MNKAALARTLHKWFGLIIGLQVAIWLTTGLYMVIVDLDFIHGDPLVRNMQQAVVLPASGGLSLASLQHRFPAATKIALHTVMDRTYYLVSSEDERYLIDPQSGKTRSPLDEKAVRDIAAFHFNAVDQSLARIERATLIAKDPPQEIGARELPLWRVDFKDRFATSFYIDPYSGVLVTRRHQYWRIFDFLWMFHIMDYQERTDVNNLLLKSAQILGLTLAVTGIWLLYFRLRGRRKR